VSSLLPGENDLLTQTEVWGWQVSVASVETAAFPGNKESWTEVLVVEEWMMYTYLL
jgi:hypothetical protein